jgi:hypothetical protein
MEAHKRPFLAECLNPELSAITDTCLAYTQKSTWKKVTKRGRKEGEIENKKDSILRCLYRAL